MESISFLKINAADNVAVAIQSLSRGQQIEIDGVQLTLRDDIPAGHKFALTTIAERGKIIKYGYQIGMARADILAGELVNEKRIKTALDGLSEYQYTPNFTPITKSDSGRTFEGYRRASGEVGVRNEIVVLPTVGCVNGVANTLAERMRRETNEVGVDAIVSYPHNYGCSQLGADHENTRKVLRDIVLHPNVGGVLVVGLGCENNQVEAFAELVGEVDESRVKYMICQNEGDEIERGLELLREIYGVVKCDRRESIPLSELRIGLKCGGSDGFSGITGNPLLGLFSDYLVSQGGSSILTEVPEMFGAETILMARCESRSIFDKTVGLINDFKSYFMSNNQPIYENPSPGNKAGGISTLEEKSLGCTQKCGDAPVSDVLGYGERLQTKGLNLMNSPGNDLVAATALAASGCQMVLFTTGRGTPFGTFVPTMKISTNSDLSRRKPTWIDFNAGGVVEGRSFEETLVDFTNYVIRVASGEMVNNEKSGYKEIAIFKTGVTL
ncbi:MAG: altronate dehydratase family protein [Rikenellaceae bacterium]